MENSSAKSAIEQASAKLKNLLKDHVEGKPVIREMAERIDATACQRQADRIRSIMADDAMVARYSLSARSACGQ